MKKIIPLVSLVLILASCSALKGKSFNLFTLDQDKQLGAQVAQEIANNPTEYPIVDSTSNAPLYAYVYKVRNKILNSGKVTHKNDFSWRVQIINNDSILNAFCTPGGYIYVYTGLMKYLDSEDELAGVLGHEMGHADMRHSTRQMTTMYGIDALLGAIAGDKAILQTIAKGVSGVSGLKFSRDHETEADTKSVEYLCPTDYNADGGAKFFEKLMAAGNSGKNIPFLSTHPADADRIKNYETQKANLGCRGNKDYAAEYAQMKVLLNNINTGRKFEIIRR